MDQLDALRIAENWLAQAQPDVTVQTRSAVDELLLALNRGLLEIESAMTLVEARQLAAGLRDALITGWRSC